MPVRVQAPSSTMSGTRLRARRSWPGRLNQRRRRKSLARSKTGRNDGKSEGDNFACIRGRLTSECNIYKGSARTYKIAKRMRSAGVYGGPSTLVMTSRQLSNMFASLANALPRESRPCVQLIFSAVHLHTMAPRMVFRGSIIGSLGERSSTKRSKNANT